MTSDVDHRDAFVWTWLPGQMRPVVAGRLMLVGEQLIFNYGRSYLARANAIPLYEPELPLRPGALPLLPGLWMPSCIRDAAPDAWGRRVLINRKLGARGGDIDTDELTELTYLLESGSDRPGALDFQASATDYVARESSAASFDQLLNAVDRVEKGVPLHPDVDAALFHGSSIGGARPKALIVSGERKYVAKFSSQRDVYNVVKTEYVAMRLAADVGLNVAPVSLQQAAGKDVLLVERFDREKSGTGWRRRMMVSALTMLELDEMMARYASYEELATIIRHRFVSPRETLKELFGRMLFNILCGNTDDHARNHAAFWDGSALALTPGYDICPQGRSGGEAAQAMLIIGNENLSQIALCLRASPSFLISEQDAIALAEHQIKVIQSRWETVCEEANLSEIDRSLLWRRQFLNPFAFEGAPAKLAKLVA
jgi:serine/threonine-protein kinase HipA